MDVKLTMDDLLTIAREKIYYKHRSHYDGCERNHFECLVRRMADEIERLRAEVKHWKEARQMALDGGDLLKRELDKLRAKLDDPLISLPPLSKDLDHLNEYERRLVNEHARLAVELATQRLHLNTPWVSP
jgi:regulator of replication initiation timing